MRICSYRRTRPGTQRLPICVFSCLLGALALALLLPSLAFAAPASGYQFGQSQALDQAGVSVVRLVPAYSSGGQSCPTTGLGIIIHSSLSANASSYQDAVLTDSTLLTCGELSRLDIYASSAYNGQSGGYELESLSCTATAMQVKCGNANSGSQVPIICQPSTPPCANVLALVTFTTPLTEALPFPSTASLSSGSPIGIDLTTGTALSDSSTPPTDRLTPQTFTGQNGEPGMPFVDNTGALVGMEINGQDMPVKDFVSQNEKLPSIGNNKVRDDWNQAVSTYHTNSKNSKSEARAILQSMISLNTHFTAPSVWSREILTSANGSGTPTTSGSPIPAGTVISGNQIGLPGLPISSSQVFVGIVILVILALVILALVLVLLRRKAAANRQFREEERRAEKVATLEAQRIRQEEQARAQPAAQEQQGWDQWQQKKDIANAQTPVSAPSSASAPPQSPVAGAPPIPVQQSAAATVQPAPMPPQAAPVYQQSPSLRCPNCGAAIRPGDNFCSQCRAALMPSDSGMHRRMVNPPVSPDAPTVQMSPALVDAPTVQMSPDQMPTMVGQDSAGIDAERTQPFPKPFLTPAPRHGRFVVATRSDRGYKRKYKPNEDSLFAAVGAQSPNSQFQDLGIFVVADGMGGHANGKDASNLAIQTIQERVLPALQSGAPLNEDDYTRLLKEGVQSANLAVHGRNVEQHADMGTTMTAALIVDKVAYVANVGDSRTYLYRPSEGLKPITKDHSVVASLVAAGIINQEDVYNHPKRNQIYRSLGEKEEVEVDIFPVPLLPGDVLLLCCDGLWEMTRDHTIQNILQTTPDLSQAGQALIDAALQGGGDDNISIVLAKVEDVPSVDGAEAKHFEVLATPDKPQYPSIANGADD